MTGLMFFHGLAGTALAGLAIHASLNHLLSRRLARMPDAPVTPRVSVLIPARNEAERIGRCVGHWTLQEYADYEVFVYDDQSSDDTAARVLAAAGGASRVRLIRGGPLPDGWLGKPHACHRLRAHATGEILVFADADVTPAPAALARAVGALAALSLDALSAIPVHTSPSLATRALVALQNWAALTFVPSWLGALGDRPLLAAMNGQFIAVRAEAYDRSGGFRAVRDTLAEDVALGRRLTAFGYRVRLLDGAGVLRCTPYARVRECWRANVRNLLPIFFDSTPVLAFALLALAALVFGPLALLALSALLGRAGTLGWTWLPLAEVALGLVPRVLADRRAEYPPWLALLHPLAVAALIGMGVESLARFHGGGVIEWRGRRYRVTRRAA